jgi:hypothetical protein
MESWRLKGYLSLEVVAEIPERLLGALSCAELLGWDGADGGVREEV